MLSIRLAVVSGILLLAVACGSDTSNPVPAPTPAPTPNPDGQATLVSIPVGAENLGNRAFVPDEADIAVGATITWTNNDVVTHTSVSDNGVSNSGNVAPGRQFSVTFTTAGTFPYHCTIHPGMVGSVVVR